MNVCFDCGESKKVFGKIVACSRTRRQQAFEFFPWRKRIKTGVLQRASGGKRVNCAKFNAAAKLGPVIRGEEGGPLN